jgi:hypothetical protein
VLVPGWEKTLKGNAEIEYRERLHVFVCLIATSSGNRSGRQRLKILRSAV